jgi:agmatinase
MKKFQVPVSPFDNALALDQMEVAYSTLLERPTTIKSIGMYGKRNSAKDGTDHPRLIR